jgi:hypothetical protein
MNIVLNGEIGNLGHVYIYDENKNLRMKFWFHGDGRVAYRNFSQEGRTVEAGNLEAEIDGVSENVAPQQKCPSCGGLHFTDKYYGCCSELCFELMKEDTV